MKFQKGQRQHFIAPYLVAIALFLSGCASSTARERLDERQSQSKAKGSAYAADGFTLDHRSPEPRPYRAWEFFYKHCALVSRNPFPTRDEYYCTDPY